MIDASMCAFISTPPVLLATSSGALRPLGLVYSPNRFVRNAGVSGELWPSPRQTRPERDAPSASFVSGRPVAIDERLESRVRDRLRSLKAAKYQPVELKVFPADMGNNVNLRCPGDECPHVDFPHMNWSRQQLQRLAHSAVPMTEEVATLVAADEAADENETRSQKCQVSGEPGGRCDR